MRTHGKRRGPGSRAGVVLAIACSAQLILAVDITIIWVADVQIKQAVGQAVAPSPRSPAPRCASLSRATRYVHLTR